MTPRNVTDNNAEKSTNGNISQQRIKKSAVKTRDTKYIINKVTEQADKTTNRMSHSSAAESKNMALRGLHDNLNGELRPGKTKQSMIFDTISLSWVMDFR